MYIISHDLIRDIKLASIWLAFCCILNSIFLQIFHPTLILSLLEVHQESPWSFDSRTSRMKRKELCFHWISCQDGFSCHRRWISLSFDQCLWLPKNPKQKLFGLIYREMTRNFATYFRHFSQANFGENTCLDVFEQNINITGANERKKQNVSCWNKYN